MSWYYAGPEATPVGPVSLEELHARRLSGAVGPETYVIEQTGAGTVGGWRHYREIFPENINVTLPPLPPPIPAPVAAHPLFPSASYMPPPIIAPIITPHAAPHGHYPARPLNACCAWGFALGIAGFILSFACIGILLDAPALVICILGFAQVQQRRTESGRGLAAAGAVLAGLGLLISIGILSYVVPAAIKEREQAAQQNSE